MAPIATPDTQGPDTQHRHDLVDELAWAIAADGIVAHAAALAGIARRARREAITPILVEVLLDGSAPPVARERAFGMIAARLAGCAAVPAATRSAA